MTTYSEGLVPREAERAWLADEMNRRGISNQRLVELLAGLGWQGAANNVSNWKSGLAPIPDALVPTLFAALGLAPLGNDLPDVVRFYSRRHPYLAPFLKDAPVSSISSDSAEQRSAKRPVYYARRGTHQGARFVPYQDKAGLYVAGRTRFEEDKRTFETLEALAAALRADPELNVRMVPEKSPGSAPSLISQKSLAWE